MERVQFQQEQMLAELKDLVQKGLFSQQEIKQIMKKRTAFETALVRRVAKKNDYLRYAAYEMGLEALRKKRVERLKLPRTSPSVSDYALVRRQFHIFERALKKFKSDVGLWIQYIQVAKKEGARSLVGRITARALQLHPNVPSLYIIAAQHELAHLSPSAARVLLQRGIRLNAESVEMWREYVKFELGFVESMRRRWDVLGIDINGKGKAKAQTNGDEGMNEGEVQQMQENADAEGDEAEEARRAIMQGAIVKSVISNAIKALPKVSLFVSLHELLSTYPTTPALRSDLLDHLHALLIQTLPTDPVAVRLTATRQLLPGLSGDGLVDALKDANDKMTSAVRDACRSEKDADGMAGSYADFIREWVQREDLDDSLKAYLLTSLHMVVQQLLKLPAQSAPAPLLATELSLLASHRSLHSLLPFSKNLTQLAAKYTSSPKGVSNASVWLSRLELEKLAYGGDSPQLKKACQNARAAVQGERVVEVWLWGIHTDDIQDEDSAQETLKVLQELLSESMRMQDAPSFQTVHDSLLERCASVLQRLSSGTARLARFRRLTSSYLLDAVAFKAFFEHEAARAGAQGAVSDTLLREIYLAWRRRDIVDASLAWARWLLVEGKGREASEVVQRVRVEVDGEGRQRLEDSWRRIVDESTKKPEHESGDEEDAMDQTQD